MLIIRELTKEYPGERTINAVDDLSVSIEPGRFVAIVGRSGSGKSTLLAMIGGISRPTSGSIDIGGTKLWSLDEDARADYRNRHIGFVLQFASLLPALRAIDNVALPALIGGVLGYREAYARARALLERVGLSRRLDAYPGQLSGGEQRRVAIARALINKPDILLADEPTADLDEETEAEILDLLIELHRALGLTLIVVTHNQGIAARADEVLEMRAGRGESTSMLRNEKDAKTEAALLSAAGSAANRSVATRSLVPQPPGQSSAGKSTAAAGVYNATSNAPVAERVRLGEGIERFAGRIAIWALPLFLLTWGVNSAIAMCERTVILAREGRRLALEELAMQGLRADVKDITFGTGNTYVLSIYLRNTTADQSIYVMTPAVRAFVQVGSSWQEIPLKAMGAASSRVEKVQGERIYRFVLAPDIANFAQLMPHYMHVRISNDLLVSPRSEPEDDLVERSDNYYVYLKPHDADDGAILRELKFPGTPPVWIPMPPH